MEYFLRTRWIMYWFAKTQQFELAINWNLHCTGNHNISGFSIRIGSKSSLLSVFVLTHKLILTVMTWNDIIIAYVTRRVTVVMKPTVWLSKYLVSPYHFMINLHATSLNICWNPCVFIRLLHAIPFLLSNSRSAMWRLLTQWTYECVSLVTVHLMLMLAWAAFIPMGPGAVLDLWGRKMAKATCEDVLFLAYVGASRGP